MAFVVGIEHRAWYGTWHRIWLSEILKGFSEYLELWCIMFGYSTLLLVTEVLQGVLGGVILSSEVFSFPFPVFTRISYHSSRTV